MNKHVFASFMLAMASQTVCQTAAVHADTIDLSFSKIAVHVSAISPTIFRVSIRAADAKAVVRNSLFIDPNLVDADSGRASRTAGHQQLKTDFGMLDIDINANTLALSDAHGKLLIPPASLAHFTQNNSKPELDLHLGWPANQAFAVYGCGNGEDTLIQHQVNAHLGNGIAIEPFFWSPVGFASLVITSNDDAPAQCNGKIENGAITWSVPGSSADLYLVVAPTLADASQSLIHLTGHVPVPPRWTFGYLQSRWGWKDQDYVNDTLHQFETRKFPVDAFIFDYEWYTPIPDSHIKPEGLAGFDDFGWNQKLFPDLTAEIKTMHDAGVHFVGIRKPRIGNTDTLADIHSKGWNYHNVSTGMNARGFLFSSPEARDWYAKGLAKLLPSGIDGWWNDEGEFTYSNYLHWNQAERIAHDAVHPDTRFWTINRAFQPGLSRLGAVAWTGDVHSTWPSFQHTPTALLNWSMAGMPFCACDIGGFQEEANPELLVRWMEAGTFFPMMRTHSSLKVTPHFPWLFGTKAESAMKKAIELRYQLLPTIYSLAHATSETGEPMMRPLFMQYSNDPKVADLSSEWLLGHDLLAAPILEQGNHKHVYLPDDTWYDFTTNERIIGPQQFNKDVPFDAAPLYVRAGAILPLGPIIQHTRDLPGGPLTMHVYPGRDGQFTLVEDDGDTNAYLTGNVRKTIFTWNDSHHTLSWTQSGTYNGNNCFRSLRIALHDGVIKPTEEQPFAATGSISF